MIVDFEEVVSEAILTIGAKGDDELARNFCRTFIYRAWQQLGMSDQTIEVTKIEAKNLLLRKPKNLKKFLEIALYDENDNFIPHSFKHGGKRIYPNEEDYLTTVNAGTDDEVQYYVPVDLSENQTSFVIGTNGTQVAYAMCRYYAIPLDGNGWPIIREEEVEPCVAYARYKWSQRLNENQSEIRENKITWQQLADRCIALKKSLDNSEESKKAQAKQLNRMLPNFNRSSF